MNKQTGRTEMVMLTEENIRAERYQVYGYNEWFFWRIPTLEELTQAEKMIPDEVRRQFLCLLDLNNN